MKKMSLPGDDEAYATMLARARYNELVLCTSKVSFTPSPISFSEFSLSFICFTNSFIFLSSFLPWLVRERGPIGT